MVSFYEHKQPSHQSRQKKKNTNKNALAFLCIYLFIYLFCLFVYRFFHLPTKFTVRFSYGWLSTAVQENSVINIKRFYVLPCVKLLSKNMLQPKSITAHYHSFSNVCYLCSGALLEDKKCIYIKIWQYSQTECTQCPFPYACLNYSWAL